MLLLSAEKIKKTIGEKVILEIERLKIYGQDRIGLVGANGVGKTTLLNLLVGADHGDEGMIRRFGKISYLTQFSDQEELAEKGLERETRGNPLWKIKGQDMGNLSGGEMTRLKLARALDGPRQLLLADEPTNSLDLGGIKILEEQLKNYAGAMVIVSHDRELLDHLCEKILEIEKGKVTEYKGNYSDYRRQKEAQEERSRFEYEDYVKEKKRIEEAVREKERQAQAVRKVPKGAGASEYRSITTHLKVERVKKKLEQGAKSLTSRMERLEEKAKPLKTPEIRFDLPESLRLHTKIAVQGEKISKSFGTRILFDKVDFQIKAGSKVALIGDNGAGKTTLLRMIMDGEQGISTAKTLKIGYFSQDLHILDERKSVLDNVLADALYPPPEVRLFLARLLFRGDDVFKAAGVLSGGEKVRAALAKILVSPFNMLVLDEPTNYLDIPAREALEKVMQEYGGTILFVTHDRRVIEKVATDSLLIEGEKLIAFPGTYGAYLQHNHSGGEKTESRLKKGESDESRRLQLENRLSEVVSRLSLPSPKDDLSALDAEYQRLLTELKGMKG